MASFRKRGNTWQYVISNKGKQIRKSGFRTKKEAQTAASEIENKLHKGINPHLNPEPINEYFQSWYELYKTSITNATLRHYEYTLKAIDNYFGSTPIQNITKRKYKAFINDFGQDRAKETVDKVNGHIRACILDAVDEGIVSVDFTRDVKIYFTTQSKRKEEKHLNYKDSELLMKETVNRLDRGLSYYAVLLALASGLRVGELLGLTRKDFDFKESKISVNKTIGYSSHTGSGFMPTKNESSYRTVRVSPKVMSEFKKLFMETPTNIDHLVFHNASSKYKVISHTTINKSLIKMLQQLNLNRITVHGLRHTYASILLYKRLSLGYVSVSLGHKNTIRTQQDYEHVLSELENEDGINSTKIFDAML